VEIKIKGEEIKAHDKIGRKTIFFFFFVCVGLNWRRKKKARERARIETEEVTYLW
jgi:hypothetical protein